MTMTKSFDIVGYDYQADTYCDHCICIALGSDIRKGTLSTEAYLDLVAIARAVDRMNEHSFDSGEFPKVIFADNGEFECASCGEYYD